MTLQVRLADVFYSRLVAQNLVEAADIMLGALDTVQITLSSILAQMREAQDVTHKLKSKKFSFSTDEVQNLGQNLNRELIEVQGNIKASLRLIGKVLSRTEPELVMKRQDHSVSEEGNTSAQTKEIEILKRKVEYLKTGLKKMTDREIQYQMQIRDLEQQVKRSRTRESLPARISPGKTDPIKLLEQKEARFNKELELTQAKLARAEEKNLGYVEEIRTLKKDLRQAKQNVDNQNDSFQKQLDKEVALIAKNFKLHLEDLLKVIWVCLG